MLHWIRTRSRRDLILAVAVAAAFFVGAGWFLGRGLHEVRHVAEYEHRDEHRHEHSEGGGVLFDRTFDVRLGGLLEVQVGDVDVAISNGSGEARVVLRVDDHEASDRVLDELGFTVLASNGDLSIRTEEDSGWDWRDGDDYDLSLEVTVPSEYNVSVWTGDGDVAVGSFEGEVQVQTGDGDVAVGEAEGRLLRVQTGDGDIAIGEAESREVRIQTGDGDVAVSRLYTEMVSVRTGDGDIFIQDLSGALEASTGDGDVQVHVATFDGIEIRSGDGDVTLYMPVGVGADVELSGSDFVIGEAFALPVQIDGRDVSGVLNGGGAKLSIRVGDGTVRLEERR